MKKFKAMMVIIICIAIWGGCIASAGTLGFMFGWCPVVAYLTILAMFD